MDVVVGPRRDAYKPLVRLKRLTQLAAFKYMGVFQSCYLDFLPGVVLCVLNFCGHALVSVHNIKGFTSFYHCTSDPKLIRENYSLVFYWRSTVPGVGDSC